MDALKLVIFDVDGTLIDSQHAIVAAMAQTVAALGLRQPSRAEVLGAVGLSLPMVMERLFPEATQATQTDAVTQYKRAYAEQRRAADGMPAFFPGLRSVLEELRARPEVLLATATGMSRRGMRAILDGHDLGGWFASLQTADDHPSKPNPAMVNAALAETGVAPQDAVFVGDTTFDIQAGRAAGVFALGVTWGHHADHDLTRAGAHAIARAPDRIVPAIDELWSKT